MLSPRWTSRSMSRSTQNGLKYDFHQPNIDLLQPVAAPRVELVGLAEVPGVDDDFR